MNPHAVFPAALEASWQGSLAIILILALRPLLGARIPAGWRSWLWTLALLRLLVPASVLPPSPASMQNFADAGQSVQRVRLVWESPQPPAAEQPVAVSPASAFSKIATAADWPRVAALIWLGGACLFGGWLVGGAIVLQRRLAREGTDAEERVAQIWRACCACVAVRAGPRLIVTDAIASPALVGVLRPMLLLPRAVALSREDCEHIFLHELAHYRRRDHWMHFAQLGALCLHWFNPLVWIGFRYLRADRELAADEWALQHLAGDRGAAYGETLLRLLAAQHAPAFPHSAIGILEDGAQLKERLRRIVAFRPRRRAGSIAGLALVVGMAAIILTAAENSVDSLKGWTVISVAIPKSADIRDAYVEMKSPAGRVVTLTSGVTTQEGVTLEKIEWNGTPIRAAITLRKGEERAELSADAGLVSKNNELSRKSMQVEIESKFVEVPDALAESLKFPRSDSFMDKFPGTTAPEPKSPELVIRAVLSEGEAEDLIRSLNSKKGVDLITAPRVTSRSGQRAMIEIIREFRYPSEWNPPDQTEPRWTAKAWETRNVGVTLEVEPMLAEGDGIDLKLTPQVVEFLGFVDVETKKPLFTAKADPTKTALDRTFRSASGFQTQRPFQAIFSTRKSHSELSIQAGQTVVLIGPRESEDTTPFDPPSIGRQLVVLIRARRIVPRTAEDVPPPAPPGTPAENAKPDSEPVADRFTKPFLSAVPAAKPVPSKPGFVTSPHAPKSGYVDVRGFSKGTEVKCPYTGKMFRVP